MKVTSQITFLLLCAFTEPLKSAKILVSSPISAYSHANYIGRLADILVEAGHDVTVSSLRISPQTINSFTKLAKTVEWVPPIEIKFEINTKNAWEGQGLIGTAKMFMNVKNFSEKTCEMLLMDQKWIDRLKAENFDFGLCEMTNICCYALFRKIGITNYATAISTNIQEIGTEPIGISNNPSFVPTSYSQFSDRMSYTERFANFMLYIGMKIFTSFLLFPDDKKFQELSSQYQSFETEIGQTSFLFVNSDEFLDFPRLISHKIIYIGGIAIRPPQSLNREFQELMDNATNGAVLMSFGTIAKSTEMSDHLKAVFVEAFKSLPNIKFLWKYEDTADEITKEENIILKSWLPQNDLLYHRNLRAFITHCGLNSLLETVYAGVPIVCIPLYGDQLRNTKIAEERGIGVSLNKKTMSSADLMSAVQEVLENDKYRNSVQKLSRMIREKPFTPYERFLRNIEFAIKFGPMHNFDIASNFLNVFQYYLLDIIIPLIIIILFIIYFSTKFILKILYKISNKLYKSKTE